MESSARAVDDQDMVLVVGEEAADRFRQHVDREDVVLQDIVDDFLGEQLVTRRLLERAGEDDRRNGKIDEIVQRLAVFRARQVDVGNRQRDLLAGLVIGQFQLLEAAADLDIDVEKFLQPRRDHGREDV